MDRRGELQAEMGDVLGRGRGVLRDLDRERRPGQGLDHHHRRGLGDRLAGADDVRMGQALEQLALEQQR
jgi:hypothetical protein